MKNLRTHRSRFLWIVILVLLAAFCGTVLGEAGTDGNQSFYAEGGVRKLAWCEGTVKLLLQDGTKAPAHAGDSLTNVKAVYTSKDSIAVLWLDGTTYLLLEPNSKLILQELSKGCSVELEKGSMDLNVVSAPEKGGAVTVQLPMEMGKIQLWVSLSYVSVSETEEEVKAEFGLYRGDAGVTYQTSGGITTQKFVPGNLLCLSKGIEGYTGRNQNPPEADVYPLPEDEVGAYQLMMDGTKEYLLFNTYDICMQWLGSDELCSGPERCFHKEGKGGSSDPPPQKKTLTVTTGSGSKAYDGTPLTCGDVRYTGLDDGDAITVTATGKRTSPGMSSNTFSIQWGKTDRNKYEVVSKLGSLEVTPNDTTITVTAGSAERTYDGTELTCADFTVTGLPEGLTCTAETAGSLTDAGEGENSVASCRILDAAGNDVTACFTGISPVKGRLTVTPAPLTVTTGSAEKEWDGTPLTCGDTDVTGLTAADREKVTVTADGSITDIGTAENIYTISWNGADPDNYVITANLGTLKVTPNETAITVTAGSAEKTYDGTELTCADFTVTGLPEGFTCTATTAGGRTDAGEGENSIASCRILDAAGNDVTSCFAGISLVKGKLTVTPAPAEPEPENEEPDPKNEEPDPENEEPDPKNEEPDPENEEPDPENEEPDPETGDPEPEPETEDPEPEIEEPTAESEEPKPESEEPGSDSEEPKTESEEPKPESEEP